MNSKKDPMGRAIADYWKTKKAERLRVFSPMFEEDEIPLQTLFRKYEDMPDIELKALDMAKGKTLDVGAGAGCHSLVLQEKGFDVTAIDISPLSVQTMKERGVKNVLEQDFFTLKGQYDTILMLMNGIGIVGTLERLPKFFRQLDNILAPGGQVLCDSSDISYVFEDENGMIDIPNEMDYYIYLSVFSVVRSTQNVLTLGELSCLTCHIQIIIFTERGFCKGTYYCENNPISSPN